jgi:hypothetical protein
MTSPTACAQLTELRTRRPVYRDDRIGAALRLDQQVRPLLERRAALHERQI